MMNTRFETFKFSFIVGAHRKGSPVCCKLYDSLFLASLVQSPIRYDLLVLSVAEINDNQEVHLTRISFQKRQKLTS